MDFTFKPSGDTGLTIEVADKVEPASAIRVARLRMLIDRAAIGGVIETVPSYRSVLVHYDPLILSHTALIAAVRALDGACGERGAGSGRTWSIPVCFEGEDFAPDLAHVARWAGMAAADVVSHITGVTQYVYMLGFAPGQPYLGDLPDRLAIPRRKVPVLGVPPGSLVTATGKTVIYPHKNPTGWYIVGRTPLPLFDATAPHPALLHAGDRVRLAPVSRDAFEAIAARLAAGTSDARREADPAR